jgi:hypothetical protein
VTTDDRPTTEESAELHEELEAQIALLEARYDELRRRLRGDRPT